MTRLYLVRYGETVDNEQDNAGTETGRLTAKGEAQAREVMRKCVRAYRRVRTERPETPIDTCAIIAERTGSCNHHPTLRERDWGIHRTIHSRPEG